MEDLNKVLPEFVNQLNVPLIAVADSRTNEIILLQDESKD